MVGEREISLGIPAGDMLALGSSRLRKPIVEEATVSPTKPVIDSIENALALFVFVKAQMEEVVHQARRLRVGERIDELRLGGQGI